uniref:DNA-directed RNA polymerase subunit n=1 Tax=Gonium pectorale TaxID=33097 RepID=M1V1T4_GONPE|nr:chloroplast RNA polymerase beta' chain [Gonium pectorale]BAM85961.1 chloroplast RNA polymerase beta' chain [Gonium pectorale]
MLDRTFQSSYSKMTEINLITISLATANRIRQWAEKTLPNGKVVGEVINPETVHYKTLKPIKGGLFCERIFGPLKDHECACGKKFNIKNYLTKVTKLNFEPNFNLEQAQRVNEENAFDFATNNYLKQQQAALQKRYFCRVCDVEYTYSIIRRTQLGYIQLASPTTHVWFVKGIPSYISILLDMKKKHLQNVTYNSGTLTLEHSLRGRQNLPSSPKSIFESWQKIMKIQYPDKYKNQLTISLTLDQKSKFNSRQSKNQTIVSISEESQKHKKANFSKLVKNKILTNLEKETKLKKHDTLKQNKHQLADIYMFDRRYSSDEGEGHKASEEVSLQIQNKKARNWKKDLLALWDSKIGLPNKIKRKKLTITQSIVNSHICEDIYIKNYNLERAIASWSCSHEMQISNFRTGIDPASPWRSRMEQNFKQKKHKQSNVIFSSRLIYNKMIFFDSRRELYKQNKKKYYSRTIISGKKSVLIESSEIENKQTNINGKIKITCSLLSKQNKTQLKQKSLAKALQIKNLNINSVNILAQKRKENKVSLNYKLLQNKRLNKIAHPKLKFCQQIYSQKGWFKLVSKILTIENRKVKNKKWIYNKLKQSKLNIGTNNQNVKFEYNYSSEVFYTIKKWQILKAQQKRHKRELLKHQVFNSTNKMNSKRTNVYLSTQSNLQLLISLLTQKFDCQIHKKTFTKFIASTKLKQDYFYSQEMQSPLGIFSTEFYSYISTIFNFSFNNSFLSSNNPNSCAQQELFNFLKIQTKKQTIPLYLLVLSKDQTFLNFVRSKLFYDASKTFLPLVQIKDNWQFFGTSKRNFDAEEVKRINSLKNVDITEDKQLQLKQNNSLAPLTSTAAPMELQGSLIFKAPLFFAQHLLNSIFLKVWKIFIKKNNKTNSFVTVKNILSNYVLQSKNFVWSSHSEKEFVSKDSTLMAQFNAPLFVIGNYTDSLEILNSIVNDIYLQKKNKKSFRHLTIKNYYQTRFASLATRFARSLFFAIYACKDVYFCDTKKDEQIYNPLSLKLPSFFAHFKGTDLERAIGLQFLDNLISFTRDIIYSKNYKTTNFNYLEKKQTNNDFGLNLISLQNGEENKNNKNVAWQKIESYMIENNRKAIMNSLFQIKHYNRSSDHPRRGLSSHSEIDGLFILTNTLKSYNFNFVDKQKTKLTLMLVLNLTNNVKKTQTNSIFLLLKNKFKTKLVQRLHACYLFYQSLLCFEQLKKLSKKIYYHLNGSSGSEIEHTKKTFVLYHLSQQMQKTQLAIRHFLVKTNNYMFTLVNKDVLFNNDNLSPLVDPDVSLKPVFSFLNISSNNTLKVSLVKLGEKVTTQTNNALEQINIGSPIKLAQTGNISYTKSVYRPSKKNNILMRTKSTKQALDILQHFSRLKNFKILTYYFFFLKENKKTIAYKLYNRLIADFEMLQNKYLKNLFILKTFLSHCKNAKKQNSYKCRLNLRQLKCIFPFGNINILNKPNLYFKISNPFGKHYNVIIPKGNAIEIQNLTHKNNTNYLSSNCLQLNKIGQKNNHNPRRGLLSRFARSSFKLTISNKTKQNLTGSILLCSIQLATAGSFSNILFLVSNFKNLFKDPKNFIVNNIYCLSHRELWEHEKDWQDFAYYYYSPINITDIAIPFYRHRNYDLLFNIDNSLIYTTQQYFPTKQGDLSQKNETIITLQKKGYFQSSMNINTTFSGAGLIEKLLNDFNYSELKKMDKQNRILLFEYNKYIKKLKKMMNSRLIKSKLVYYKACHIRDVLIRRTKLTRKIFNNALLNEMNIANFNLEPQRGNINKKVPLQQSYLPIKIDSQSAETSLNQRPSTFNLETNGLNMILTLLPVLPPVLRPVLKMAGQFTISDLNRLYQRIIYRNERLKKFLKDPALSSSFEMKYAQRLLQEAVDNLIQNGKSGVVPEKDARGRLLKSLSDILKGKQGRFRQYLLGKRVDYSGRSVIVVGPRLKLHECGIPKDMALVLYSPFLIKRILNEKLADTYLSAKKICQTNPLLVSQLLREIMRSCPVLLNRAPTLHRLGFQAFQPKLVDGKAILLHPLVCPAFNADFDGDQMAVHVPITFEARAEAWKLMLARNNLLSPATGEPLILPSQDMVLGCYYLTTNCAEKWSLFKKGSGMYFHSINDVLKAYNQNLIHLHAVIWVNIKGQVENGNPLEQPLEIRFPLTQFKQNKSQQIFKFLGQKNNDFTMQQNVVNVLSKSNSLNIVCNVKSNLNYIEIYSKTHNVLNLKGIPCGDQIIRTTPGKILFNMIIKKAIEKRPALLSKYNYSTGLIKNKLLNTFDLETSNFFTRQIPRTRA